MSNIPLSALLGDTPDNKKALKVAGEMQLTGNNAQQPFSGDQTTTHKFDQPQNALVVSNDGDNSVFVKVNKFVFEVKAGEVFTETFYPFTEVQITSNGVPFRAYGKGVGGVATFLIQEEYFVPLTQAKAVGTNSIPYKGSEFTMTKDQTLHYVAQYANVSSWQLWEVPENALTTLVASGDYEAEKDGEGYAISHLANPVSLVNGKKYVLISKLVTASYNFVWNQMTTNQPRMTYPITTASFTVTGRSFSLDTAAVGSAMTANNYVYDIKLGLEG
ncbi:hypothetical protein [Priestia filamentosa]|uniref:hypothetical protein n=1 Tax=Priestia filamentosa TaxID=1402861 RepID=UPI0039828B92